MDFTVTTLLLVAICGVTAGTLAGLFGVGGGIIFVPVLVFVFSFDQLGAQATSLAAIIPVAIIGAWLQSNDNLVNWRAALLMGIGAAIGVLLGAEVATRLDNANLAQAFGAVLVLAGGEMIVSSARRIRGAQA